MTAMTICTVELAPAARPDQLKELADRLERWCDHELDTGGCYCAVDPQHLSDLKSGERPLPGLLRHTAALHRMSDVSQRLGGEPVEFEPWLRAQLEEVLGADARSRDVVFYTEYSPEYGCEDAVENVTEAVGEDLLVNVAMAIVPSDESDEEC